MIFILPITKLSAYLCCGGGKARLEKGPWQVLQLNEHSNLDRSFTQLCISRLTISAGLFTFV